MSPALVRADPREGQARALVEASHALMQSLYPAEANHYLDLEALAAPDVWFYLATSEDRALGCCALAVKDGYGEVKSLFVDPAARGAGLGRALLAEIEAVARAEGLEWLRLETGTGLDAAHGLYRAHGFRECGAFGAYEAGPFSVFFEKRLR